MKQNFLKVNYESHETILSSYDQIADRFAKHIIIEINGAGYRIIDFEFYSYAENFADPHTYKNDLQLLAYKFYLHGSGIDITFGDGKNHGGILLRSVIKLSNGLAPKTDFVQKQFNGSQIVATELFSNLKPLNIDSNNIIRLTDIDELNIQSLFSSPLRIMKTQRVGLTKKEKDKEDYYKDLNIRYIILVSNFKQKIKDSERIFREQVVLGTTTPEDAKRILGYNLGEK